MISLARQKDRYDEAAVRLQEAGKKAEDGEATALYGRAWAQAFTASRHVVLADRNARAADGARTTANLVSRRPRSSQAFLVRAKELDLIAARHREAAQTAAQKAAELEFEAAKVGEQGQQQRPGQPPRPQQRPAPPPPRGGQPVQPVQRPPQAAQPIQRPPAPPAPQPAAQSAAPPPLQPALRPRAGGDGDGDGDGDC